MNVLLFGIGLVSVAFVLHLVVWRFLVPRHHTFALLKLFLGVGSVGFVLQAFLAPTSVLALNSIWEFLHLGLFYGSTVLGYVIFYSALENESPTLMIVLCIAESGAVGRRYEDVHQLLGGETLLKTRIALLVHDSLIIEREGSYVLTEQGRRLAKLFSVSAAIVGLRRGG